MKNIITTILLLICLILGYFVFFGNSSNDYKKKLADLAMHRFQLATAPLTSHISLLADTPRVITDISGLKFSMQIPSIGLKRMAASLAPTEIISAINF